MNNMGRNIIIWLVFGAALLALFNLFQSPSSTSPGSQLAYSDFIAEVEGQQVVEVVIDGRNLKGTAKNGRVITSVMPEGTDVVEVLNENDVRIIASPEDSGMPSFLSILLSWFPMLLFIGIWVFFMRQMQGGSRGAMGFGKSRAKLLTEHHGRVTFEDVAGIDEAKTELEEVVEFLKDPGKFQRLGGKIPKGVLLVGPPGTGKTLLAKAIAGEANVPFFTISGSDFVEMFVGVGASRVRDMFEQGKKNAPCIIFIDEIDAVGRHRGAGLGGGNDEREQTLNQMLVEMDGFEANEGVILIAATNRPDVLDPALLRPGRFDRQVVVPNPDVVGREKILKVHMRKTPLAEGVDARIIARGTPGFSGADLANLVNEAALLAARKGRRTVSMQEFEEAKDKVMLGIRAPLDGDDGRREAPDRLPRGRPRRGRAALSGLRPDPQGNDHPARPCARHGDAASRGRPYLAGARTDLRRPSRGLWRAHRRGTDLRRGAGDDRRVLRHPHGDRHGAAHGHRMGHVRQARLPRLQRR